MISIEWAKGLGEAGAATLTRWVAANLVGFSYTPAFLKDFGTGSVNGSLWTIPVELQFYLVLPVLMVVLKQRSGRWSLALLVAVGCSLGYQYWLRPILTESMVGAVGRLLLPWLYMFMLGMLMYWRKDWVARWLEGRFLWWLSVYALWITLLLIVGVNTVGNYATPFSLIPLAALVVSGAFTNRKFSYQWLKGNDISYGLYLYHMPVINLVVATNVSRVAWAQLLIVICGTFTLAILSWWFVERPAIRLKSGVDSKEQAVGAGHL